MIIAKRLSIRAMKRINQCHDSDDRYDVIVEGVDAVLSHRTDKRAAGIAPRLLLWERRRQLPSPMGNMMQ